MSRTADEPPAATAKRLAALGAKWKRDTAAADKSRDQLKAAVVDALRSGEGSVRTLAAAAGVNPNTIAAWKKEAGA